MTEEQVEANRNNIEKLSYYDRCLFHLYFEKGLSLRKISKGTGISLYYINKDVKRIKQAIKQNS